MFTACVYRCVSAISSGSKVHPFFCQQQHLVGKRVMTLTPCMEPKDSNYPLKIALSFALWLMFQLTQKYQKSPGKPHLIVQCCKSGLVHILFLCLLGHNGAILKFILANTHFSKRLSLGSVKEGERKGAQGYLNCFFSS